MISSEGPPLLRASVLVDALEGLPRELRARGHEVGCILPLYREIRENEALPLRETGITVEVPLGDKNYLAELWETRTGSGVQVFLVRCDEFFDREGIYGEGGDPYEDNAARFIFFSKAALELARRLAPAPQILHVHDWAAALVPVLVKEQRLPFATVLTIHHLADQGSFWGLDFGLTNLPEKYFTLHGLEFFGRMNLLKGGILYADRVTTVSEHYRREMHTPEGGCGLDMVIRENSHKLVAIQNGADYQRWDPATDEFLPVRYERNAMEGKDFCRAELLAAMQLAPRPGSPVYGMVTRLVSEKGFDVLMPVLDRLLSDDARLIILGEGDPAYETALAIAARKYPTKFAYHRHYDERLAHLIEAGSDLTLIPSRFEPSGLSAMYSLRYGALPVARATGGIQEIIEDYDPWSDSGYGFLYYDASVAAFWDAVKRAREIYYAGAVWPVLIDRAMGQRFSWESAAQHYEELYAEIASDHSQVVAPAPRSVVAPLELVTRQLRR